MWQQVGHGPADRREGRELANDKIGPRIPKIPTGRPAGPAQAGQLPSIQAPPAAQEARVQADPELFEQLPGRGLASTQSVLQNVIQAGLDQLARAQNWTARDNALGVLVKAMSASSAAGAGDTMKGTDSLPFEFQQLLAEFQPDRSKAREVRQDAERLVALSVVALGTDGVDGSRRQKEEQISADVLALKDALGHVLRQPPEERDRLLAKNSEDFAFAAQVFGRGSRALQAADVKAPARFDALASIFQIVAKYASA